MRLSLLCGHVLLLATLGFSQQQPQPPSTSPPYTTPPTFSEEPQMPPDHKAPPPEALSTTQVEQQIQDHFKAEPGLANTNVTIEADDSSVVLSGIVDNVAQHALALRIAGSYAGDRKIVDKITVRQQT
jgi:hypothetical protein